ncbi:hypothetical protein [Paenibacillus wenxiniae]|uniref:Uncharacterized protein n=1 Tax=Paenibacillus wenxiniae TaxID=1636843 RepID=A0ABW4RDN0_9BACL
MNSTAVLERKNEILRRNIDTMIMKNNKDGLSRQENNFYHTLVKEWHQNQHEMNQKRDEITP